MKTVMVFGTFDILHPGHLDLFKQAKQYAERLVVVLARDARVREIKGKQPFHTEDERKSILGHVDIVDEAILGDKDDVYKVIRDRKPDVIALGYDQEVFVSKLQGMISDESLPIQIIRLEPYNSDKFKTGNIKKHIAT